MILTEYLKKLNVESYAELNDEEKKTYKEWEEALNGRKLTDDDVRVFLETEKTDAVLKLSSPDIELNDKEDTFLKMKLHMVSKLIEFLLVPELEKKMAEGAIRQML